MSAIGKNRKLRFEQLQLSYVALEKQHDELLAALRLYVEHFGDPLQVARAAIEKAEGKS